MRIAAPASFPAQSPIGARRPVGASCGSNPDTRLTAPPRRAYTFRTNPIKYAVVVLVPVPFVNVSIVIDGSS